MNRLSELNNKVILVTGARGFIGKHLVKYLSDKTEYSIRALVRNNQPSFLHPKIEQICVQTDFSGSDWARLFSGCETIVHLAARVHVMKETHVNPWEAYYQANVTGTLNLARQAAALGVKRFIYLSTIKVNGEVTKPGHAYRANDVAAPEDFYAMSKYQAEQELFNLAADTEMQVIVIRPPLVYGPQVKGNFQRMIHWLQKGYPLPLGSIQNKRSFLSIYNLIDLIHHCIEYSKEESQIFLASDGEDISTTELFKKLAKAMQRKAHLLPCPYWVLNTSAKILGKRNMIDRLFGSLQVNIEKTRQELNWKPIVSIEEALHKDFSDY